MSMPKFIASRGGADPGSHCPDPDPDHREKSDPNPDKQENQDPDPDKLETRIRIRPDRITARTFHSLYLIS